MKGKERNLGCKIMKKEREGKKCGRKMDRKKNKGEKENKRRRNNKEKIKEKGSVRENEEGNLQKIRKSKREGKR